MALLMGREQICRYLDCSWSTVRRRKTLGLPIRRCPAGRKCDKPCLDTVEFETWVLLYDEQKHLLTPFEYLLNTVKESDLNYDSCR
jgi:hypothetical protein